MTWCRHDDDGDVNVGGQELHARRLAVRAAASERGLTHQAGAARQHPFDDRLALG